MPYIPAFFDVNVTSSSAIFNGNVRAGGAQTAPCVPPGEISMKTR